MRSYEGVLASYLPPTTEPFSCFGEEEPGLGPLYGDELLLVDTSLFCRDRDRDRGRGASDAAVRESLSRSADRSTAEGGKGNASGNPVM